MAAGQAGGEEDTGAVSQGWEGWQCRRKETYDYRTARSALCPRLQHECRQVLELGLRSNPCLPPSDQLCDLRQSPTCSAPIASTPPGPGASALPRTGTTHQILPADSGRQWAAGGESSGSQLAILAGEPTTQENTSRAAHSRLALTTGCCSGGLLAGSSPCTPCSPCSSSLATLGGWVLHSPAGSQHVFRKLLQLLHEPQPWLASAPTGTSWHRDEDGPPLPFLWGGTEPGTYWVSNKCRQSRLCREGAG